MGAGKSSLVLRFVKGQFFDFQARHVARQRRGCAHECCCSQESTIGAAFLTQTVSVNDATVKFEIWHVCLGCAALLRSSLLLTNG